MGTRRFREAREKKMDMPLDRLIEYFVLTKQMEGRSPKTNSSITRIRAANILPARTNSC